MATPMNHNVESFLYLDYPQVLHGDWNYSWFDVGRQQMLLFLDGSFYIWSPTCNGTTSEPVKLYTVGKQNLSIVLAKVSLDSQLIVVQINKFVLIVIDVSSGKRWEIVIKSLDGNEILPNGLIWSDHGGNSQDLVIVTTRGLELYKISSGRGQCKLSRSIEKKINYFWYEPNFRAVLLGTLSRQSSALEMSGYFLRFDIGDIPRLELPPPDKMPSFSLTGVDPEDIKLITLYGSLYCATHQSSPETDTLILYSLTKTKVTKMYTFPLFVSSDVKLSVVDNLLCCHCLQSQMSFIFDIMLSTPGSGSDISPTSYQACGACTIIIDDNIIISPDNQSTNTATTLPKQDAEIKATQNSHTQSEVAQSKANIKNSTHVSAAGAETPEWVDAVGVDAEDVSIFGYVGLGTAAQNLPLIGEHHDIHQLETRNSLSMHNETFRCLTPPQNIISVDDVPPGSPALTRARYVKEAYSGEWQLIFPDWVWIPSTRSMLKLKCNMFAVISSIHEPMRSLSFMSRRGLSIVAPKPVYVNNPEVATKSKKILLQAMKRWIDDPCIVTKIDNLFEYIIKIYSLEFHRRRRYMLQNGDITVSNEDHVTNSTSNDVYTSDEQSNDVLSDTSPGAEDSSNYNEKSDSTANGSSSSSNQSSSQTTKQSWGFFGFRRKSTADAPPKSLTENSPDNSSHSDSVHSRMSRRFSATSIYLKSSKHPDDEPLPIGTKECIISPPSTEPIESSFAVNMLLPDMGFVGGMLKGVRSVSMSGVAVTVASSATNLLKAPLTTKRNTDGCLIMTQIEMLCYVWIPLINASEISDDVGDRYLWPLSAYIAMLRKYEVDVEAAVSLLHINLLASQGQYPEIARLVQLQFYSDKVEVAAASLELCDAISLVHNTNSNPKSNKNHNESDTSNIQLHNICPGTVIHVIATLKQSGLDMFWRLRDRAFVVKWLLEHNYVIDAINLCMKRKGKWRIGLSPTSVPGIDFFRSAISEISLNHANMSEGKRVELLFTVYKFLADWDTTLIAVQKISGKSKLAALTIFPENVFNHSNTIMFQEMFGFL